MQRRNITVDGNEATAKIAHLANEVIAIYPITPASPMGELADAWSNAGRRNVFGADVVQRIQTLSGGLKHRAVFCRESLANRNKERTHNESGN